MKIVPYKDLHEDKKTQITRMFDRISAKYDLLNRLLSMGVDKLWRKHVINTLSDHLSPKDRILDLATGTCDLAIGMAQRYEHVSVVGVDLSKKMLKIGQQKIDARQLSKRITLQQADAEQLPFEDHSFALVSIAFGLRNFANLDKGIRSMLRVLKKGGNLVILEFSTPDSWWFSPIFSFYSKYVLPQIGALVSGDRQAYAYIWRSVQAFPQGKALCDELKKKGFEKATWYPLTLGICSVYVAQK